MSNTHAVRDSLVFQLGTRFMTAVINESAILTCFSKIFFFIDSNLQKAPYEISEVCFYMLLAQSQSLLIFSRSKHRKHIKTNKQNMVYDQIW